MSENKHDRFDGGVRGPGRGTLVLLVFSLSLSLLPHIQKRVEPTTHKVHKQEHIIVSPPSLRPWCDGRKRHAWMLQFLDSKILLFLPYSISVAALFQPYLNLLVTDEFYYFLLFSTTWVLYRWMFFASVVSVFCCLLSSMTWCGWNVSRACLIHTSWIGLRR